MSVDRERSARRLRDERLHLAGQQSTSAAKSSLRALRLIAQFVRKCYIEQESRAVSLI